MSWDSDLVRRIEAHPTESLVGLLCLLPSEFHSGAWTTRRVRSIWRGRAHGEEALVFVDSHDAEFCADMTGTTPGEVENRMHVASMSV